MRSAELEPKAQKALEFLHEKAGEHAQARANADHLEDWLKVELARIKGAIIGVSSDAERTQVALAHQDYRTALEALKTAREVWYTAQFKRGAAEAIIEAWRTCCSNERRLP
jgi:hypothetical protein